MRLFEELMAIHPESDVLALLEMESVDLLETLAGCRVLYGASERDLKEALRNARKKRAGDRETSMREILALRAQFSAMTDEECAAIVVEEE